MGRGTDLLTALTNARAPLDDVVTVLTYELSLYETYKAEQEEVKATAQANLDDLQNLVTMATETHERA